MQLQKIECLYIKKTIESGRYYNKPREMVIIA